MSSTVYTQIIESMYSRNDSIMSRGVVKFMIEIGEGICAWFTVSTSCGKDGENLAGDMWSWCFATLGGENLTQTYERERYIYI